jgi:Plasmid pRiA4b ORF-3-like protein
VTHTHFAITVELVTGRGTDLWPRPGRVMIASRSATFEQLATAIDDAFARWDRSHLHEFTLADGTMISPARWWGGDEPAGTLDGATARLGRLRPGDQFAYTFDLGDSWQHLCTVAPKLADPQETLGIMPDRPLPAWGWGDIPDQYGRRWNGDDGETRRPPRPDRLTDLPPILPMWGPCTRHAVPAELEETTIRYRDLLK